MAKVHTIEDLKDLIVLNKRRLGTVVSGLNNAKRLREELFSQGLSAYEVHDAVTLVLNDLKDIVTQVKNELTTLAASGFVNASEVRVGNPPNFTHWSVDATNAGVGNNALLYPFGNSGSNQILGSFAGAGGAGTLFSTGDIVEFLDAEDSDNNQEMVIDNLSSADQIVAYSRGSADGSGIAGGDDNSWDTSLRIRLKYR